MLFLSRWPVDQIGETKPGSTTTDKIVDMSALGVPESTGGLTFVPAGYPGAGRLKYVSWPEGAFYDLTYAPDGSGTYDITGASVNCCMCIAVNAIVSWRFQRNSSSAEYTSVIRAFTCGSGS